MVGGLTRGLISMDGRFASFVNAISLELACLGSRTRMEREGLLMTLKGTLIDKRGDWRERERGGGETRILNKFQFLLVNY